MNERISELTKQKPNWDSISGGVTDPVESSAVPEQLRASFRRNDSVRSIDYNSLPERFRRMVSFILYNNGHTIVADCGLEEKKVMKITECTGMDKLYNEAIKECRILIELRGISSIPWIYDFEADNKTGTVYLLMEKLTCLGNYLSNNMINLIEIPVIGVQLCDALIQLRNRNIFHLDISVNNIFYDSGKVKIGDFGSARHIDELDSINYPVGTVKYMAPESYTEFKHDERSEIYAAGMVLYLMCNGGMSAFCPVVPADKCDKIRMTGEPLPLPQYAVKYPDLLNELGDVLLKACAYDPDKRYQTFEEFRTAIAEAGFNLFLKDPDIKISARYGDKQQTVFQPVWGDRTGEDTIQTLP